MPRSEDAFAKLPPSHLEIAATAFDALTSRPRLLSLDCTTLAGQPGAQWGLPARPMLLRELREWMLEHRDNYPARNAIWRELISRARKLRGEWLIAAIGMAIPRLVRDAGTLARDYRGDPADIDAAMVEGFLHALTRTVDLTDQGLYAKLCWAGFRAGHAARYADADVVYSGDLDNEPAAPHRPYTHVDLLLSRAVALGLIDQDDAELITQTGLEHRPIEDVAEHCGADVDTVRARRKRAGARVAEALVQGHLNGPVSVALARDLGRTAVRRHAASRPADEAVNEPAAA
jgi:DNA-directed RNA polymerase specialized sigma24 family protein